MKIEELKTILDDLVEKGHGSKQVNIEIVNGSGKQLAIPTEYSVGQPGRYGTDITVGYFSPSDKVLVLRPKFMLEIWGKELYGVAGPTVMTPMGPALKK